MSINLEREKISSTAGSFVVQMNNISKRFGNVQALDDVSFSLEPGEIRALVGENGAGKSTLMNILYGMYKHDQGQILIGDEDAGQNWTPNKAIDKGLGMIHQHFSLILNHTVMENIAMSMLKWTDLNPPWKSYEKQIKNLCDEYNFMLNLHERVEELSMGERQQVEILKALNQGARILILDEPTSVLTPQQIEALLKFLQELRSRGHSVVMVTHKLNEVMDVSDRITVLRNGKHVGTLDTRDATPQKIARMMVDRDWITEQRATRPPAIKKPLLETENISVKDEQNQVVVDDVSLQVSAGEVVGIAGVSGNGQIELAEALLGLRKVLKGRVKLLDQWINRWSVGKRIQAGIRYIPEDRHSYGVVLEMSVYHNLIIDALRQPVFCKYGLLRSKYINNWTNEAICSYNIKTLTPDTPVDNLSGGNQQKVVLARALSLNPKVIISCQPTSGLDFGAAEYVRKKLLECAAEGIGVLLVSSDLDEIMELSHRIVVMFRGRIVGELERDQVDIEKLGLMMAGHTV